ncbi:protein NLRC5-like [Dendronephthya gigantea]|uniref:protein NLRC5-like n=1 Tax=Dendronephthya gigantea TaxID=151771 RepID=UPI001069E066|nr:protein NLRC5-like [Dendronephthya gigantea]
MPGTHSFNQTVVDNDLDSQMTALGLEEAMVLTSQSPVLSSPNQLRINYFLENVESTKKLTISLAVLDDDLLLKRLESTVEIHTIEIHSRCAVHKVLSVYSLPSCLKILRIINNILNYDDIFALIRCFGSENNLQELDLSRTKFEKNCFHSFITVLVNCSNLTRLILTDNCLTKEETFGLLASLKWTASLRNLNLSKNNLTVFEMHGQFDNIVSLDLSHSALQGNTNIIEICKLQALEEINLSHNHIRFSPLPEFDTQLDKLSINMKTISLSFNYLTPENINQFCFLIKSNLTKLYLDSNHICSSIWSLCSLSVKIKHLKVLSLANTDVCVAVDGLAFLLSLAKELEELDLSSNNLVLDDFRQLQLPLSNLKQLKKLNLSNNPEGASDLLQEILSSFKNLQELRLSNTQMNGEDLGKISNSLASLRDLRYLDLSMNAIDSDGKRTLANLLKGLPLLEGLDLSQSSMRGSDLNVLWNSFASLKVLKYLNLSGNQADANAFENSLLFVPSKNLLGRAYYQ